MIFHHITIDSELLYRGTLYVGFDCHHMSIRNEWEVDCGLSLSEHLFIYNGGNKLYFCEMMMMINFNTGKKYINTSMINMKSRKKNIITG